VVAELAARLGCSTTQLLDGRASERDQRIELEIRFAQLAIQHGESQEARDRLNALLAEDGLPAHVRDDITMLVGQACSRLNDLGGAVAAYLPLFQRACRGQSHLSISQLAIGLCGCYLDAGDFHQAVTVGQQGLQVARDQRLAGTFDYFRLAATVMAGYMRLGDWLHARVWAQELAREAEVAGNAGGEAVIYWNSALLASHEGRLDEALTLCEKAMARLGELDNTRDLARMRLRISDAHLAMSPPQVEQAEQVLAAGLEDLRNLGSKSDLAWWNVYRSMVDLHRGDASNAEARARTALELFHGTGPTDLAAAMIALSDALTAQGKESEADAQRAAAFGELHRAAESRTTSLQWREVAERMAAAGQMDVAHEAFRRALDGAGVRDRSGALRSQVEALRATAPSTTGARPAGHPPPSASAG